MANNVNQGLPKFFQDIYAENKEFEAQQVKEAQAIEALAGEKQTFDIDILSNYYSFADLDGVADVSDRQVQQLKNDYYMKYPNVKTLKEYAGILTKLDSYDS